MPSGNSISSQALHRWRRQAQEIAALDLIAAITADVSTNIKHHSWSLRFFRQASAGGRISI
jgi:hypothetical protein